MRVPSVGMPLFERRIVREARMMAERMLAGHRVNRQGLLVRDGGNRGLDRSLRAQVAALAAAGRAAIQGNFGNGSR